MVSTFQAAPQFEFGPSEADLSLPASFSLSADERDFSVAAATAALATLPFVHQDELTRFRSPTQRVEIPEFPIARIIASPRDMTNWAAQGMMKRIHDGRLSTSIDRALWFARSGVYRNPGATLSLRLFTDEDDQKWGLVSEGVHRIMAAKYVGDEVLHATVDVTIDADQMDSYPGRIVDLAL
jgi:hypothetical protein